MSPFKQMLRKRKVILSVSFFAIFGLLVLGFNQEWTVSAANNSSYFFTNTVNCGPCRTLNTTKGSTISSAAANGNLTVVDNVTGSSRSGLVNVTDANGTTQYHNPEGYKSGNWYNKDGTPASSDVNDLLNASTGQGTPALYDGNKNPVASGNTQEMQSALDKLGQQAPNNSGKIPETGINNPDPTQNLTAQKDKCLLITPGMSAVNGLMYGQSGVKAKNDEHLFKPQACPIVCLSCKPEQPTPRYENTDKIPYEACVYAVDAEGKEAKEGQIESEDNFKIRKIQKDEKIDPFMVTMESDFEKLVTEAKKQIRENAQKCKNMSNEKCILEEAGKTNGKKTYVPEGGPKAKEHKEYYFESEKLKRGYTVPSGKKMRTGAPYTVKQTGYKDVNGKDVEVTEACIFQDNTVQPPSPPNPNGGTNGNGGWPQNNNNGGGPGGGSPGGDQGGLLDKLLPALMQGLGSLGQGGGGGNQGQQSPASSNYSGDSYGTPTPYPYVCPTPDAEDEVCGTDGMTYESECEAEYENQATVKHTGACTEDDVAASTSDIVSNLTTLLGQLTSSGIPDEVATYVTDIVTELMGQLTSSGVPSSLIGSVADMVTNLITNMISSVVGE